MAKLEFLNNNDGVPLVARKIYPIGARLRWIQHELGEPIVIKVAGYSKCTEDTCTDCDKNRYMVNELTWMSPRCHFRKSDSPFGLCYWEEYCG